MTKRYRLWSKGMEKKNTKKGRKGKAGGGGGGVDRGDDIARKRSAGPSTPNRPTAGYKRFDSTQSPRRQTPSSPNASPPQPAVSVPLVPGIAMRPPRQGPRKSSQQNSLQRFRAATNSSLPDGGGQDDTRELLGKLLSKCDEIKATARDNPAGDVWRMLRQVMACVLEGTVSQPPPLVLLPVHTLSIGTIVSAVRGAGVRTDRVTLQIVSDVLGLSGNVGNVIVSDGEFMQSAQYWLDDSDAVQDTGKFGTFTCETRWLAPEGCLLIRSVEPQLDSDAMIGAPTTFQLPPLPAPTIITPSTTNQTAASGSTAIGHTVLGTGTNAAAQLVRSVECHGECKRCPVITRDGYHEVASAAASVQMCITVDFPPPKFDAVKDASRGSKRALETVVTNRVRRYALCVVVIFLEFAIFWSLFSLCSKNQSGMN
jgi:hypothetical protein